MTDTVLSPRRSFAIGEVGEEPSIVVFRNDPRDSCWGNPGWPSWVTSFRPHQWDAFVEITEAYETGAKVVVLDAPVGCLAGETEVVVNRGGRGFRINMRDLHEKLQGRKDGGKSWDLSMETRVQQGDMETMTARSSLIESVTCSGLKDTLDIYVQGPSGDSRSLRLTPDHRVMTLEGWRAIGTLSVGDKVLMNSGRTKVAGPRARRYYPYTRGVVGHPRHSSRDARVPTHVLVVEADRNGYDLKDYVTALRNGETDFEFIPWPEQHVHHVNGDTEDYRLDNLEVLPAGDHNRRHADVTQVAERLTWRGIRSIEWAGPTMTYDITMAEGGAHFIANGFYVHNSGKTILAEMVRRWLAEQSTYICSSKALQDQFVRDFPYARLLKGRSNYRTVDHPDDLDISALDCDMRLTPLPGCMSCPSTEMWEDDDDGNEVPHCSECHPIDHCPYRSAKAAALGSNLAILNTSYFLTECNGPGMFRGRPFTIVDECDVLESEILGYYTVTISRRRMKAIGLEPPKHKTMKAGTRERSMLTKEGEITTTEWREWFDRAVVLTGMYAQTLRGDDKDTRRERQAIDFLLSDMAKVADIMASEKGTESFIYCPSDYGDVTFKPVVVDDVGERVLWEHGSRWLLMSGSVISADFLVESLGLPATVDWRMVNVDMTFPKVNRPVAVIPIAEMSMKNKQTAWPLMGAALGKVAEKHPSERILVHGVSYAFCEYLMDRLPPDRAITYRSASERDEAMRRYLDNKTGILVAPSMDRGIDLPDDDCRVQVICKLPFPNLGDKQISRRLYGTRGGQRWYAIECVRSLVQMTGRAVRHKDDYAMTYILDKNFVSILWAKNRSLLPTYLRDAIDWGGRL